MYKVFQQGEVFPLGNFMDPEAVRIWTWIVPEKMKVKAVTLLVFWLLLLLSKLQVTVVHKVACAIRQIIQFSYCFLFKTRSLLRIVASMAKLLKQLELRRHYIKSP